MTAEQTFFVAIWTAVLTSVVAPLLVWLVNRRKSKSESDLNVGETAKAVAEGGETAVEAMKTALGFYDGIIKQLQADNEKLKAENDANRGRIIALEAQIVSNRIDDETKRKRLIARIEAGEEYIKLLVDLLSHYVPKEEIPPMPEILTESQTGIKAVK